MPAFKLAIAIGTAIAITLSSCKKETDFIYEVDEIAIDNNGDKENVKSTTEFISIAYSDLYNTTIPTDTLLALKIAYESFGDKRLIQDRIVRHFLNSPGTQLPSNTIMRSNLQLFVKDTYVKLYNREPDAMEQYFISTILNADSTITPELVYYAMMSANEYRYY